MKDPVVLPADWRRMLGPVIAMLSFVATIAGCGSDFHLCSDIDGEPPNCEVCSNGRDDDLDGEADCDDKECEDTAFCADRAAATVTSTTSGNPDADSSSTTLP